MKVMVTGTRGFPHVQGGVETHCEHLYPILVKKGCDVTVITRKTYIDPSLENYKGVNLVPVFNPRKKSFEAIVHTFLAVLKAKKLGCDVLHIHAIGPAIMVPFARLLGLKAVMTNHGPDYDRQKWGKTAKFILRLGEMLGSKFSNKVISISKPIADNLKVKYKCDSEIIFNGVVIPEMSKTDEVLKKFGLEKGKYILTVGRFVPEKGYYDLMKAYQEMGEVSGYKLVIVGDADHEDEYSLKLKQMAQENKNIILTGRLTGVSLEEIYSHGGLFILPSYHEGLPIALLEALSYGLSCIVSDIPANKEVGLDEARYFKAGDIQGMSTKIYEYVQKPLNQKEQETQIEMVCEKYNWEKIAEETLKVYEDVVKVK